MLSAVSPSPNRIVLYRRQMARIGCALAARLGAAALVTGDSLGQVSSQTLPNMTSVDDASTLPVLRPLLTWDKREVMAKAAALGILALSELAAEDACPLFTEGKQRTAVPRAELLEAEAAARPGGARRAGGGGGAPASTRRLPRPARAGVARGLTRAPAFLAGPGVGSAHEPSRPVARDGRRAPPLALLERGRDRGGRQRRP